MAILGFLADCFPDSVLLPPITDAFRRAQAFSAVAWLSSSLLPAYGRVFRPANICDVEGTEDRIKALATQEILAGLTLADKHLDGRDWWVGQWSIADAYLYYIECAANRTNADNTDLHNLARHIARMEERPSVKHVTQGEKEIK